MLQATGSQRIEQDLGTEQQQFEMTLSTEYNKLISILNQNKGFFHF